MFDLIVGGACHMIVVVVVVAVACSGSGHRRRAAPADVGATPFNVGAVTVGCNWAYKKNAREVARIIEFSLCTSAISRE